MATDQSTKPRELTDQQRATAVRALLESAPPPMIEKSIDAFRRDLPDMLVTHCGKWVAYHGDERIGFGNSQTELYNKCFGLGLTRDDFVVCGVDEGTFDPDAEIETSLDV